MVLPIVGWFRRRLVAASKLEGQLKELTRAQEVIGGELKETKQAIERLDELVRSIGEEPQNWDRENRKVGRR